MVLGAMEETPLAYAFGGGLHFVLTGIGRRPCRLMRLWLHRQYNVWLALLRFLEGVGNLGAFAWSGHGR